jgi:hypothetical protein
MNIFKAVLFAGMVLASQATAQTFVRFHSGVNPLSGSRRFRPIGSAARADRRYCELSVSRTPASLTAQFAKVQTWRANRVTLANPRWRIRGRSTKS